MKSFPVEPVGNKIIVLPLEKKEEKMDSGIIIPESANAELREAEVVAVSVEVAHLFEVGETVLYPLRKGVGQVINNKGYLWLDCDVNRDEIWGKLTNEN